MSTKLIPLDGPWTLTLAPGPHPLVPSHLEETLRTGVGVRVPGTLHAQLLALGLIPDPRQVDHEAAARWVGWTGWRLTRDIEIPPGFDSVRLEFDGIDTVAGIRLDDALLGSVRNMHRRHRFTLDASPGTHRLSVEFAPPEAEAKAAQERFGARPNGYDRPFEALRKMACNFGWDWGPDFPSSGLWRSVRLAAWNHGRLGDILVDTFPLEGGRWRIVTTAQVETADDAEVRVSVAGASGTAPVNAGQGSVSVELDVDDPALWWPRSHGEPALHEHRIDLLVAGELADTTTVRTGFRTITLDTSADETGSAFRFIVNGEPVQVRGVNWIPNSCFPGDVTVDELRARFDDITAANCNLVRVWGGGAYESEDFYDLADELGVLVWQDFLFACSPYPEDDELRVEVEAEALDNVRRLQRRASLALWCGNNEIIWGEADWGWRELLDGSTWGREYFFTLLPGVVSRLDPRRPYYPGTPWSGGLDRKPNDPRHGCVHVWDVWNQVDFEHYLRISPRFVSEFGYQGPPVKATMREAIGAENMHLGNRVLGLHQKHLFGWQIFERGHANYGYAATDFDQWWWRSQRMQAHALRVGVAHFRSLAPTCAGFIWWQLNDCWPVMSWAIVDSAGRRKPAWYALRDVAADRLVALLGDEAPELRLINDSRHPWSDEVEVTAIDVATGAVSSRKVEFAVPPRSTATGLLGLDDLVGDSTVLVARAGESTWAWYPRRLWPSLPSRFAVDAVPTSDGWAVTVRAEEVLIDASLQVDHVDADARVDSMLVTLLPGESHTFQVTGAIGAHPRLFRVLSA